MVCKVMPPVRHKLQKQQQKLIHNNKKNRVLIVNGDNPDNYATLKLDLESNGFIVDTFADPVVALNNFRAGLYAMVSNPICHKYTNFITIMHANQEYSRYDHLAPLSSKVKVGQTVR
jgi:hypothetical protein